MKDNHIITPKRPTQGYMKELIILPNKWITQQLVNIQQKKLGAWPTLRGLESCCVWSDGDTTRTGLSSVRGGVRDRALATLLVATPIFHWTMVQGTLDVTMFGESDDISVVWGCLSFKQ